MRDGYDLSESDDGASAGLDEFLCEYVDGTMDPAVRAAFEEYLRENPQLYEHIECLRETRSMLCRYGCRLRAPAALQQRLRERLGAELQEQQPLLASVSVRLSWFAGFSSLVLMVCGFWAAQTHFEPHARTTVAAVTSSEPAHTGYLVPRAVAVEARSSSAFVSIPGFMSRPSVSPQALPGDSFITLSAPLRPALSAASIP